MNFLVDFVSLKEQKYTGVS